MSPEVELIRALAEHLALEILASYSPEDFAVASPSKDDTGWGAHQRSRVCTYCH